MTRLSLVGVAVLIVLGVSSCAAESAPTAPTSSATQQPSPTPTAEPDLTVTEVTLSLEGISSANAGGEVVQSAAFDGDAATAVALLTAALGSEPNINQEATGCWGDHEITQWWWGDEAYVSIFSWQTPAPHATWRAANDFYVRVSIDELAGIGFESDAGDSVGDPSAALFAALPAGQVTQGYGEDNQIGIAEVGGEYDDNGSTSPWGLAVEQRDGAISTIAAPSEFLDFFC